MRIFMFKSRAKPNLRAFSGEPAGLQLPQKYGPWDPIGVVRPDVSPPHGFSRKTIEAAIERDSFQLWVTQPLEKAAAAKAPAHPS
ncbi:MAG: hypothetical protein ACJ8EU_01195 [Xanthobacteraceae bacterium]